LTRLVQWTLLAGLAPRERREFVGLGRSREFGRHEIVCHAGDPADALHLVEAGHLAVRVGLSSGATATLNILSPGDYFGELALLSPTRRRTATVVALEPSRTLAIAGSAFDALRARNPAVERALSTILADRVDTLSQRLVHTMYDSLDRRVLLRLVELASSYDRDGGTVTIPLSQAELADLVGATRPPVNQVLQRLASQHVIVLRRARIDILDVEALARACDA
jgi:CRP/FNR family transcriptional regulator, cyclic AMP receptor protein